MSLFTSGGFGCAVGGVFVMSGRGFVALGSSLVAEGHGEAATIGDQVDKTVEIR